TRDPFVAEFTSFKVLIVHIRNLELASVRRSQLPHDVKDSVVVKVEASNREIADGSNRLLYDPQKPVSFHDRDTISGWVLYSGQDDPRAVRIQPKLCHQGCHRILKDVV